MNLIIKMLIVCVAAFIVVSKHCDGRGGCDCDCSWANSSTCTHDDGSCCYGCCCTGGGGGSAGTTRYWDCNQPFCEPGKIPYPHQYAMWKSSDGRIFGHAAAADSILKGKAACEHCYSLTRGGSGQTVVVKVDNWCPCNGNPACCQDHFDLAVPGFDYAAASQSNVCQKVDSSIDYSRGKQQCQNWPQESCNCNAVSSDSRLNSACSIFLGLNWNNPQVSYKEIACPFELQGNSSGPAGEVKYIKELRGMKSPSYIAQQQLKEGLH